jgi:hypothetical protein
MATEEKDSTAWMQTLWRPAMGWLYMLVCFCDMIVFPVLWALWQGVNHVAITQWNPLSLQGAGLFHIAMGAVLGIAAFGRTQEKLAGTAANPTATVTTQNMNMSGNTAGGYGSGMNTNQGGGFGGGSTFGAPAPMAPAFGATPLGGNTMSTAPAFGSAPAPAFGTSGATCPNTGKPLGPDQSFPAL